MTSLYQSGGIKSLALSGDVAIPLVKGLMRFFFVVCPEMEELRLVEVDLKDSTLSAVAQFLTSRQQLGFVCTTLRVINCWHVEDCMIDRVQGLLPDTTVIWYGVQALDYDSDSFVPSTTPSSEDIDTDSDFATEEDSEEASGTHIRTPPPSSSSSDDEDV